MPHDIPELETVHEDTTPTLSGVIREGGEGSDALPGSTLSTLTVEVYHVPAAGTPTTILVETSILNVNNGTVDEEGNFAWVAPLSVTAVQNDALKVERHFCLFTWTWGLSPVRQGRALAVLPVRNLQVVP